MSMVLPLWRHSSGPGLDQNLSLLRSLNLSQVVEGEEEDILMVIQEIL